MLLPWWARTVCATGLTWLVAFAGLAVQHARGHGFGIPPLGFVLIGAGCLIVAALIAIAWGQDRDRYLDALSVTTSKTERMQAIAAVRRGPVPENPRVREAAARMAQIQLGAIRGTRIATVTFSLLVAIWLFQGVLAALDHRPGEALLNAGIAALFAFALVSAPWTRRRLQARVETLRSTDNPSL
ncbi:hypothetical protein CQY20_14885 [Mycolicibacterium agri]|uniref:Uncharacterized protein n=1 Tax=Mycolicibacterium agri TaxID=36811 RepID=A0A2A7N1R0_MYCAG|nr:hypothetical protein CQY20_14885 [Mycolicibacterium agri]